MAIFTFTTTNPARTLTINAENQEAARVKFRQMRDAAGLTEESELTQVIEIEAMKNIVEHTETEVSETVVK